MAVTGVTAMADRPVDELSGGELQRVWLATCLAQDTEVLLLDEPTTFLDLRYQVEILDLVRDLADTTGWRSASCCTTSTRPPRSPTMWCCCTRGGSAPAGRRAEVLTEDLLSDTYGIRIEVSTDPAPGGAHPAGRPAHRRLLPSDPPREQQGTPMIRPRVLALARAQRPPCSSPPRCGTTEEPRSWTRDGRRRTGDRHRQPGQGDHLDARRSGWSAWSGVTSRCWSPSGVMPVGVADVEGYSTWVTAAPLDDSVTDVGTRRAQHRRDRARWSQTW